MPADAGIVQQKREAFTSPIFVLRFRLPSTRCNRKRLGFLRFLARCSSVFLHLFFYTLFRNRADSGNNGKRRKVDFSPESAREIQTETTGNIAVLNSETCVSTNSTTRAKTERPWIRPASRGARVLFRRLHTHWTYRSDRNASVIDREK